ncbi:hypothetical protein DIPPA_19115, partial [Diplonema papillatum]
MDAEEGIAFRLAGVRRKRDADSACDEGGEDEPPGPTRGITKKARGPKCTWDVVTPPELEDRFPISLHRKAGQGRVADEWGWVALNWLAVAHGIQMWLAWERRRSSDFETPIDEQLALRGRCAAETLTVAARDLLGIILLRGKPPRKHPPGRWSALLGTLQDGEEGQWKFAHTPPVHNVRGRGCRTEQERRSRRGVPGPHRTRQPWRQASGRRARGEPEAEADVKGAKGGGQPAGAKGGKAPPAEAQAGGGGPLAPPCWEFAKTSECRFGERCRFQHARNDAAAPACWDFATRGCSRETCRFRHVALCRIEGCRDGSCALAHSPREQRQKGAPSQPEEPEGCWEYAAAIDRTRILREAGATALSTSGEGGNCGYRALLHAMDPSADDVGQLRRELARHIATRSDYYKGVLGSEKAVREYVQEMGSGSKWMGHLALQAAADMRGACIIVVKGGRNPVIRIGEDTRDERRILVVAFGNGHYEKVSYKDLKKGKAEGSAKEILWKRSAKAKMVNVDESPAHAGTIEGTLGVRDARWEDKINPNVLSQLGLRECVVCGDMVKIEKMAHAACAKKLKGGDNPGVTSIPHADRGTPPGWGEVAHLRLQTRNSVPRPLHRFWAETLTRTLKLVNEEKSEASVLLLCMLPKTCLGRDRGGRKAHNKNITLTRDRLVAWGEGSYSRLWEDAKAGAAAAGGKDRARLDEEEGKLARATTLTKMGGFSMGNAALVAEGLAEDNNTTWEALLSKHPKAAEHRRQEGPAGLEAGDPLSVPEDAVLSAIKEFPR